MRVMAFVEIELIILQMMISNYFSRCQLAFNIIFSEKSHPS